jgi:hypothetical protein
MSLLSEIYPCLYFTIVPVKISIGLVKLKISNLKETWVKLIVGETLGKLT